jgi:uncharacterized protein
MYYHRDLEVALKESLGQFPSVLITGPRQAGKSTLLREWLEGYAYVTLDDADVRAQVLADPKLFLRTNPAPLIIDEIQYAPELLSYIKILIDENRDRCGQFVLTGSQVFQLMEGVSESLAGRISLFHLYPFSWREINNGPEGTRVDLTDERAVAEQIVRGFYPEVVKKPQLDAGNWIGSYISTYLERDVRNIRAVSDLDLFQRFLSLLATRVGSLLNLSELAKECGISQPTARSWVSILESTYVIFRLRPYFANHGKRLVKSPKLYFIDTGLACHLLGIDTADRFLRASERGHLFENMVIAEWMKRASLSVRPHPLYFYRTPGGTEIDLLVDQRDRQLALEIKFSHRLTPRMAQPIERYLREHSKAEGYLLSLSPKPVAVSREVPALHWSEAFDLA